MKIKQIYVLLFMMILVITAGCSNNIDTGTGNVIREDNPEKVTIYFFWGDGCPHCENQKPFLTGLEEKYGDKIEVKSFETWHNPENVVLFQEIAAAYNTRAQGVPATFIGEKFWVGYADRMAPEIEAYVQQCIEEGCVNPGDKLN